MHWGLLHWLHEILGKYWVYYWKLCGMPCLFTHPHTFVLALLDTFLWIFFSSDLAPQMCTASFDSHHIVRAAQQVVISQTCWTHRRDKHDFFINYRVASEGKPVALVSSLLLLATKKVLRKTQHSKLHYLSQCSQFCASLFLMHFGYLCSTFCGTYVAIVRSFLYESAQFKWMDFGKTDQDSPYKARKKPAFLGSWCYLGSKDSCVVKDFNPILWFSGHHSVSYYIFSPPNFVAGTIPWHGTVCVW